MVKSGVYKISNKLNGNNYIGSSKDIINRWKKHRYDLNHNIHTNTHLQNAWNKYGEEQFDFIIVEECVLDKKVLLEREQNYIDLLKPEYNILPIAGSRLGSKHTEETKNKISKNNVGMKGKTHSFETKQKIGSSNSVALKGRNLSENTKRKLSESLKGKSKTEEHCNNISEARKGIVFSDDTKKKLSETHLGHKVADETKAKISQTMKGRVPWNKGLKKKDNTNEVI